MTRARVRDALLTFTTLASLTSFGAPAPARAQEPQPTVSAAESSTLPPALQPGRQVRFWWGAVEPVREQGTILGWQADTMVVSLARGGLQPVPIDIVQRLESREPTDPRRLMRNGALAGLAVGIVAGAIAGVGEPNPMQTTLSRTTLYGLPIALLGAVLWPQFFEPDWEVVELP